MRKKILVTIAVIGCLSLAFGVGCSNSQKDTKTSEVMKKLVKEKVTRKVKECKIKKTKDYNIFDYIKDGDYASDETKKKTYEVSFRDEACSIKDVILPELTIDSDAAKRINKEVKELYLILEEGFESFVKGEDSDNGYVKSEYKAYINGDILSVVIKMDYIYDEMPVTPCYYYTFNINLETKERVEFEDLCDIAGFDKYNVDSSVLVALKENKVSSYIPKEELEEGVEEPLAVDYYKRATRSNSVICFINEEGYVSVISEVTAKEDSVVTYAEIPITTEYTTKGSNKSEISKYVEDTYYASEDVKELFYVNRTEKTLYSYRNMRLPKIKIDSEDAKKVNDEIKALQKSIDERLKQVLKDNDKGFGLVTSYTANLVKDVLSISITLNDEIALMPDAYTNYNFDVKSGKLLSFDEVVEKLGKNKEDIDKEYKKQLEAFYKEIDESAYTNKEKETKELVKVEMSDYKKAKKDDKLIYFIDDEGIMNISIEISTPNGIEDYPGYYDMKF